MSESKNHGSKDKYSPRDYTVRKPANTIKGLQADAYKLTTAQERKSGRTHYFLNDRRVSTEDAVAISAKKDRPAARNGPAVFHGVDLDSDGKIKE